MRLPTALLRLDVIIQEFYVYVHDDYLDVGGPEAPPADRPAWRGM